MSFLTCKPTCLLADITSRLCHIYTSVCCIVILALGAVWCRFLSACWCIILCSDWCVFVGGCEQCVVYWKTRSVKTCRCRRLWVCWSSRHKTQGLCWAQTWWTSSHFWPVTSDCTLLVTDLCVSHTYVWLAVQSPSAYLASFLRYSELFVKSRRFYPTPPAIWHPRCVALLAWSYV